VSEFLSNLSPLMVFLGIAAIGFVFLISLLIGDVFDNFGMDTGLDGGVDGHGFLDSRVISVFITSFGGFGAIGIQSGLGIEIRREQATSEQAGPLSEAKARQEVVAEEVRIERIRTQEQIAVQ
jgi:hypothetical protein